MFDETVSFVEIGALVETMLAKWKVVGSKPTLA